jgi:hypothetical protein
LAYFEPALKLWFHLNNFYQFACFPLQHTSTDNLNALETGFQTTYRPQYNWPWINSLLTKFHIGKQRFGPVFTKPFLDRSRKFSRRYQKRTPTEQMCLLGRRLYTSEAIYKLLIRLGSDTIEKFHVSRLLRSTQTDVKYLFLLCRLSHHLGEPFRTRSQSQLRLILQFKGTGPPPPMSLCAFRSCQILWTNKSSGGCWASHFIMLSFFPPFHKVRAPYVRIRNRTLGQLFFTFPSALTWWTPDYEP